MSQAFVEALHPAFLIAGVVMLCAALLAGVLLRQKRRDAPVQATVTDADMQVPEIVSNARQGMFR